MNGHRREVLVVTAARVAQDSCTKQASRKCSGTLDQAGVLPVLYRF